MHQAGDSAGCCRGANVLLERGGSAAGASLGEDGHVRLPGWPRCRKARPLAQSQAHFAPECMLGCIVAGPLRFHTPLVTARIQLLMLRSYKASCLNVARVKRVRACQGRCLHGLVAGYGFLCACVACVGVCVCVGMSMGARAHACSAPRRWPSQTPGCMWVLEGGPPPCFEALRAPTVRRSLLITRACAEGLTRCHAPRVTIGPTKRTRLARLRPHSFHPPKCIRPSSHGRLCL